MDSKKASDIKKLALGGLVLGAFTVPVFRSGGRTGLTFVGWVVNHTVFGPPIEYVPEESYTRELEGVEIPKQLPSTSQLEGAKTYYQISEPSARELLSYQQGGGLMEVTVRLKNPPSGANRWGLSLYDWTGGKSLSRTVFSIDGEATFDIPPDWAFPLRFWIQVIYYSSVTVLHQAQSLTPGWPNYIEEFIPEPGSYYYNVATKRFELIEPPEVVPCEITITAPNSAAEGEAVNASVTIRNVSAYNYSYKATIYAVPDLYPDYIIGSIDQIITSGSSVTRNVFFTMPDCDVTVFIWVERWALDHWVYDNSASKVVSFEAILYKGTISKKELEYDETRSIIPVY